MAKSQELGQIAMPFDWEQLNSLNYLQFTPPIAIDYFATLLWALTGAIIAGRRGYDFAGAFGIALISATGGGLLRDGIFIQNGPPQLVRTPAYLMIVLIAVIIVQLFGTRILQIPNYQSTSHVMDALGAGMYAVVGMQAAKLAGLSILGVGLVGVVNGIGGGLLRDVFMRRDPEAFMPGTWFTSAIAIGCVFYILLTTTLGVGEYVAAWITIFFIFALRIAAIYRNFRSRPLIPAAESGESRKP